MATRKVSITLTRTYQKTGTIEIDVDENIKDEDLISYLSENNDYNDELEEAVYQDSLDAVEDEYRFDDHDNNFGGHL